MRIGKDQVGRDCPDMFEETFSSAFGLARRDPELFEVIADRVEGEASRFMAANNMARFCLP